jgi:hypothetical protein
VGGGASDLRVPKRRLTVELLLRGREPCRLGVFLAEHQDHSWHRQEVLDLLDEEAPFFPAHDEDADAWVLVGRAAVVWVAVDHNQDEPEDEEPLFDYRREVRLDLPGGRTLEGQLLYAAPPEQARLIDYMNAASRFFRIFTADRVYLVARSAVLRLWDLSEKR